MQNNATELTQRLLRSLDSNYNVIDMPAVVEIVSLLEKVTITKELLETTRLGKHVNELRRKTSNDSLSKRAKELVKKWRNMVLPESNGQIRPPQQQQQQPPIQIESSEDSNQKKKRPIKDNCESNNAKRPKLNGQSELDLSDNSTNSSDVIKLKQKRDVILINSDSNSSLPEDSKREQPQVEQQQPKKRGRKKGSKNHKNLLEEAESSFTNKLAVSRGNSKVKTTQELVAGLQNKSANAATGGVLGANSGKNREDLSLRAAKLTERVSIIDQKLNTNANRYKSGQRNRIGGASIKINSRIDKVIESGSVINDKSLLKSSEEEIIVVEEELGEEGEISIENKSDLELKEEEISAQIDDKIKSLSVEEALAQLPPLLDKSVEEDAIGEEPKCCCILIENKPTDFSIEEGDDGGGDKPRFEFAVDADCPADAFLSKKYRLGAPVGAERIAELHSRCIENVNGNYGVGARRELPATLDSGLYVNVVPNVNSERMPRDSPDENYRKYSISNCDMSSDGGVRTTITDVDGVVVGGGSGGGRDDVGVFREWHECLDTPSYNGEIFKILPYVIID